MNAVTTAGPDDVRFVRRFLAGLALASVANVGLMLLLSGFDVWAFLPVLASYLMLALWGGIGLWTAAQLIALARPGGWRMRGRAVWLLTTMLMTGTTMATFQLFKQAILPARGFPFDPAIARLERTLLLGSDGWQITHRLFGTFEAALIFDRCYAIWLPMMFTFPFLAVVAVREDRMRARILACWFASWLLIATLAAWLFASAGPVYYVALVGPDAGFETLGRSLAMIDSQAKASGVGVGFPDFQTMLLTEWHQGSFTAAGGISAMPSMHVAMATLLALGTFRMWKPLGWAMCIYAVAIWLGSVHLGWHYALDGIVGAGMMYMLWRATGWLVAKV